MIDFTDVRVSAVQDSGKHYRISVLTDYYRPSESKISCEGTPGGQQVSAGNGLEAIAVADGHAGRINIVVTDVVMPRLGGPELVARLREKRDGFSVIFMSGYTEAGALENSKIGPDAVLLNKPFSTEVLARKISEVQQNRSDGVEKRLAAAASATSAGVPTR
jgi:CheY-like chemotaxis protein